MTLEDTAAAIRLIEGVKNVTVKVSRKREALSVEYSQSGIEVDGLRYKLTPEFTSRRLSNVRLQTETCLALATEKFKNLRELLTQKYGEGKTQREVTEDGQLVAVRDTFRGTPVRVLLRLEPGDIPRHIYGATGLAGTLASVANAMADAEIDACPNDAGQKATIEMTYLNNANSTAIDAAAESERTARRERDKSKL